MTLGVEAIGLSPALKRLGDPEPQTSCPANLQHIGMSRPDSGLNLQGEMPSMRAPLSSELEQISQSVKARFRPWLEPFSVGTS